MFGMGELKGIEYIANGREMNCACGAAVERCEVWSHVLSAVDDGMHVSIRQKMLDVLTGRARYFAKTGEIDNATYIRQQEAVYTALQARTGAKVLIDSSKMPERPMLLEGSKVVAPIMLHIIRDPRAVTWSYVRKYGKWSSHLFPWLKSNQKIEILKRRFQGKVVTIRYEDLVADPEKVLREVMTVIGLDFAPTMLAYRDAAQHQLAGNRMRLKKEGGISRDTSWEKDMPRGLRTIVSAVSAPLARKYGYR